MRWLLAGGLAAILGCGTAETSKVDPKATQLEERIETYFQQGISLKKQAKKEQDKEKREDLLETAFNYFVRAEGSGNINAIYHQADCISEMGDYYGAQRIINIAIQQYPSEKTYNWKGKIALAHNMDNVAVHSFTQAIKHYDNAESRWGRFEAYMKTGFVEGVARSDILLEARKDAQKYIELRPGDPDGYIAQADVEIYLAKGDKEKLKSPAKLLLKAAKLIYFGKSIYNKKYDSKDIQKLKEKSGM